MPIKHEWTIPPGQDYLRLIQAIRGRYPELGSNQIFKALRQKDIRVDQIRVNQDRMIRPGQTITLFWPEPLQAGQVRLEQPGDPTEHGGKDHVLNGHDRWPFQVVFEHPWFLLLNKPASLQVQAGRSEEDDAGTLIDYARQRWQQPEITLCHRLDRNTQGLIILSRKAEAKAHLDELIRSKQIVKRYRCLVRGIPSQGLPIKAFDGTQMLRLDAWLEKVAGKSDVYVHDQKQPGDKAITTLYRILRSWPHAGPDQEGVSELEVELVTGRTHQIRAHLAHIGHPLLGDGKYGRNTFNKAFQGIAGPLKRQQLSAVSMTFPEKMEGPLATVAGRTFQIEPEYDWVPF